MAKGPGRARRKGITLAQLFKKFPDDAAAEKHFIKTSTSPLLNRWI